MSGLGKEPQVLAGRVAHDGDEHAGNRFKKPKLMSEIESQTLDARKLVLCSAHGNDLACLGSERKCDVKWLPGDKESVWKLFGKALVEKKAWREGRRVFTDRFESAR